MADALEISDVEARLKASASPSLKKMNEKTDTPSNTISSPPIYNLNVDTLWKIFWINTDMFANPIDAPALTDPDSRIYPMDDLRRASQICRFWRQVALGSPALWGRVIDLDGLRGRVPWGRELISRAALAPLHIKGTRCWETNSDSRRFFLDLLENHWSTIQKLEIQIETSFSNARKFKLALLRSKTSPDDDPWSALRRPAPLLESFTITTSKFDSLPQLENLIRLHRPLFADHAPLLRDFGIWDPIVPTNVTQCILQAPWGSQLRSLMVPCSLPPAEILEALVHLPLLESLDLTGTHVGSPLPANAFDHRDPTSLPLLHRLDIDTTIYKAYLLLKHIRPSPVCSLELRLIEGDDTKDPKILRDMGDLIEQYYIQPHLTRHCDHTFIIKELDIEDYFFKIHILPHDHNCGAGIVIGCRDNSNRLSHNFLLPFLTAHQFSHIDSLYLELRDGLLDHGPVEEELTAVLNILFRSVHSVTYMKVSRIALEAMLRIPRNTQSVQIQTLEPQGAPATVGVSKSILSFLRGQVEIGKPVQTLIIPNTWYTPQSFITSTKPVWDWSPLDGIHGLRVIWGDGEVNFGRSGDYICGSGAPETLNFDLSR